MDVHVYMDTYRLIHIFLPTYIHTYVFPYLCTYILTYKHTCIPPCMPGYVHTYLYGDSCIPDTEIQLDIHTCLPINMCT